MDKRIRIAIAGNPNSGKSTIFNAITGARQRVGNYPGVTVEKHEGFTRYNGRDIYCIDLPGTYSLSPYSLEEIIARDYVVDERPDVVINVVDAANLERNLYLSVQLMELAAPMVVALNMMDIAGARGVEIDHEKLSELTGIPMLPTVAHKEKGIDELLAAAVKVATEHRAPSGDEVNYGAEIEEEIARIRSKLDACANALGKYPPRWLAAKLLEGDGEVVKRFEKSCPQAQEIISLARERARHIKSIVGDDPETVMADRRYGFVSGACQESVMMTVETRHILSDKVDAVVTSRLLGLPILLALMYAMFYASFNLASVPGEWIGTGFGWLSRLVEATVPASPGNPLGLQSLLLDGIIGGVGSVIVFLPNVAVLFFAIAAMEDSGYMARAAFVMDHLMHKIGLHGKSFIPMIIGFGCSVPGIMATRIIENRRDRITTILVLPLFSCSARLPVYALLIPAFFPLAWRAPMLWMIYMIGIALAIGLAKLLRGSILSGESHPLVMELPPYRMPTLKGLFLHTWERAWLYVRKVGTVILAAAILLWFAANWPSPPSEKLTAVSAEEAQSMVLTSSLVGRAGKFMEPALKPAGFDWRMGAAFVGAATAKEVFVAQMGIVYGVGHEEEMKGALQKRLREDYTPLAAFGLLLYALIATPCVVTLAVTRKECGSWKWAALQWAGLTTLGYAAALLVFQLGSLLGIGV